MGPLWIGFVTDGWVESVLCGTNGLLYCGLFCRVGPMRHQRFTEVDVSVLLAPTGSCSLGETVGSVLLGTNGSLQFVFLSWTDGLLGCWIVTSTICRTIKVKFEYLVGSGTFDFTRVFRRF